MKKLMTTMLAVAVGVGLHTAGMADTGTSFEGLEAGDYNINAITGELSAQEAGQTYWVTNGTDQTLTVSSGTSVIAEYEYPGTPSRPQQYIDNGSSQAKYLSIKTTLGNPVTRNVSVGGTGTSIGAGFYFDSLVKFTAFDSDQAINLDGGKLAIWLKEAYSNGDSADPTGTNLVITAGYLQNGGAVVTNYPCNVTGVDFNDGGWHRVTVKAIGSIYSEDTVPGFVVYVDGVRAKSTEAKGIDTSALTDNAYAFNSDGALFPSADQSSGAVSTISSVAFDGQGDVDDLIFTSTAPDFAKDSEFFTIELGANVASLTYSVYGGSSATITETTMIEYAPGLRVAVTGVTYAPGYMTAGITSSASVDLEEGYYVVGAAAQKITANAKAAGATLNGEPVESLADAFTTINAAASGNFTVVLNADADAGIALDNADVTVVLDLAGNDITADSGTSVIDLEDGTLYITNSTSDVGHIIADGIDYAVEAYGTLIVSGGYFDGEMNIANATCTITGGGFSTADNTGDVKADLDKAVIDGYELVVDGSYYVLTEAAPTYTIKFVYGENGATTNTQSVASGSMPTEPTAQEVAVEGKTFTGWDSTVVAAAADATYTAQYTVNSYTITFVYGLTGQSQYQQSYNYGLVPEIPDAAAITGYDLSWSPAIEAVKSNTTYTAEYTAVDYTITYMYGENELTGLTPATYTVEDAVTLPSEVTLGVVGVSFQAWTNELGQTVASWAAGAKTGNQTFYAQVTAVVPPTKYEPGEAGITPPAGKTAAEFATAINANKAAYIDTPSTSDVADTTAYLALFQAVADTEKGTVSIGLTTEAAADAKDAADDTAADIVSDLTATTVTIDAEPGLWYSISVSSTLGGLATGEGTRVMATDSSLSEGKLMLNIPVIDDSTPARFYKVNVNLADKPVTP